MVEFKARKNELKAVGKRRYWQSIEFLKFTTDNLLLFTLVSFENYNF